MNTDHTVPGTWEMDPDKNAVMRFIADIFDPSDGRFSWKDHLPGAYDSLWAWKVSGKIVSALVTRPIETTGGARGIAIGMVGTTAASRSKGFATALVNATTGYRESKGDGFAILWVRDLMIPFYSKLGFKETQAEDDCVIASASGQSVSRSGIVFRDFEELSHRGFDALRLVFCHKEKKGTDNILRHFHHNRWHGISGSRGGQIGILYGGSEEQPGFYAVVAHGERRPLILEFVGEPQDFRDVVSFVVTEFGWDSVSYSLTAPHVEQHLQAVQVISREKNFHTLVLPRAGRLPKTPIMTWLDRI